MTLDEQRTMETMLKALLAVAGETMDDIKPISPDSRLPAEIINKVHMAIAMGARQLGIADIKVAA